MTQRNSPGTSALARALEAQAQAVFSDVFGAIVVDEPYGRVTLYVTDLQRGAEMARTVSTADPALDLRILDIRRCAYSLASAEKAIRRITGRSGGSWAFPIYTVLFAGDASGLEVRTSPPGTRSAEFMAEVRAAAEPLRVTFSVGGEQVLL